MSRMLNSWNNLKLSDKWAAETTILMLNQKFAISRNDAYSLLQRCIQKKDLVSIRGVQSLLLQNGLDSVAVLGDHLIRLFIWHGCLIEGNAAFSTILKPTPHGWVAAIMANAKHGQGITALEMYCTMQSFGMESNEHIYVAAIKACTGTTALMEGRLIHGKIIETGFSSTLTIENTLVHMYSKCGTLEEARNVFDMMPDRDVISWNAMISGYAQNSKGLLALECLERMDREGIHPNVVSWSAIISEYALNGAGCLALYCFHKMQQKGIAPDEVTYSNVLRACTCIGVLQQGRLVHADIIISGFQVIGILGSILVDMYAKCEGLEEATQVFNRLGDQSTVPWNVMIAGCVQSGESLLALKFFNTMQEAGIEPTEVELLGALKACANVRALEHGRTIHTNIIQWGFQSDVIIRGALTHMYAKSGSLEEAHKLVEKTSNQNVVLLNTMIAGYADSGQGLAALGCFKIMQEEGLIPNLITYLNTLNACTIMGAIEQGRLVHCQIIKNGFALNVVLGSTLINMYGKCNSPEEACKIFESILNPDVVTWGAIIAGDLQHGAGILALEHNEMMEYEGIHPDAGIFLSVLRACILLGAIEQGRVIHEKVIIGGFKDATLWNSLVDMYSKCGSLEEARMVFDHLPSKDSISWSTMITGYAHHAECLLALDCLQEMEQKGIMPNEVAFSSALKACTNLGALERGRHIHTEIIRKNLESDVVIGSALIDMYAKCRSLKEACNVFDKLVTRDIISWGAMVAGHADSGQYLLALECFRKMKEGGMRPNLVVYLSILGACANLGAIGQGKCIHNEVSKTGLHTDIMMGNSLIDMYAKCGSLEDALKVLHIMCKRDIISWNAMIAGMAQHGECSLSLEYFEKMQYEKIRPNEVTFNGILIACGRMGLVNEGHWYYNLMRQHHGISPNRSHKTCIIDLLSRAGCLVEAVQILQADNETDTMGWTSLLNACRIHGDREFGKCCFNQLVSLDTSCGVGYVLISNIYAEISGQEEIELVVEQAEDPIIGLNENVAKLPGNQITGLNAHSVKQPITHLSNAM